MSQTRTDKTATLEAIAFGTDPRISPGDRMRALEMLAAQPGHGGSESGAFLEMVDQVHGLTGAALDAELAGFFNPGWTRPEGGPDGGEALPLDERVEREVEKRTRKRIRLWSKREKASQKSQRFAPRPAPAEPERVVAETPQEDQPRRAKIIRLDTGEVLDLGAPMTQAQANVAQSKLTRQQERDRIRERRRQASPFRDHIPPGVDPVVWERTFR